MTVEQIDEAGAVIQTKKITTTYLFLAAGSIGTTEFRKSPRTRKFPNLNEEVGQRWGTNGNVLFTRTVNELTGKYQGGPVIKSILDYENAETPAIEPVFLPIGVECGCLLHLLLA